MSRSRLAALLSATALLATSSLGADVVDPETLFVRRVWPLLKEKCLACHGDEENKIKGGLDLRTRADLLLGGDSEKSAVVPGKPDESPLILAVLRQSEYFEPMP